MIAGASELCSVAMFVTATGGGSNLQVLVALRFFLVLFESSTASVLQLSPPASTPHPKIDTS